MEECIRREVDKADIEAQLERYVRMIVSKTTAELMGSEDEREEILERYIQENGLDRRKGEKVEKYIL